MNLSKILTVGAFATSLVFAQPEAPVADQPEAQPATSKPSVNTRAGFGIHGAFEFGKLYALAQDWDLGDDEEEPSGIGFTAGIVGRIPMIPVIQFTPEINFHYLRLVQEDDIGKRTFNQMDIEVPVMVRAILKEMVYVGAGAQLGLNIHSRVSLEEDNVSPGGGLEALDFTFDEDFEKAKVGFGLVFGAGIVIVNYISVDARVVLGLTEVYPDGESELIDLDGAKQMSFQFGVGFWIY